MWATCRHLHQHVVVSAAVRAWTQRTWLNTLWLERATVWGAPGNPLIKTQKTSLRASGHRTAKGHSLSKIAPQKLREGVEMTVAPKGIGSGGGLNTHNRPFCKTHFNPLQKRDFKRHRPMRVERTGEGRAVANLQMDPP